MKIIGTTGTAYLVEATREELLNIAGFGRHGMDEFEKVFPGTTDKSGSHHSWERPFHIGATFKICAMFQYLQKLRDKERQVLASADFLTQLAEMMRGSVPSAIAPAADQSEPKT